MVSYLRSRGHEAINFDLIYGLPGQTPATFGETVEKVIEYKPSRIALYGYAHVPWIKPHQKVMEKHNLPGASDRMEIFGSAYEMFTEAGYRYIGMDHFALPQDELVTSLETRTLTRNFMGYTTRRGLDLIGIGTSSISSVGTTYTQNAKELEGYNQQQEGLYWEKGLAMDADDVLRREIIMDLFCNFYLDTESVGDHFELSFNDYFKSELEALHPMVDDGLLKINPHSLEVSQLGRYFIRNICMKFDRYLAKENPVNRYSKTI